MFIVAVYTVVRTWKPPVCPSAEEWVKVWCVYTMEYYSAIKIVIITSEATQRDLGTVIQ